jgi:acyl-coenzyme A thioesterase PaaI-like protein
MAAPQFHDEPGRAAAARQSHRHQDHPCFAGACHCRNARDRGAVESQQRAAWRCADGNLPKTGGATATIESKTNFFAAIPVGDVAKAECTPLHRGRTTTVWQTRITRGDGKLAAVVTQTQLMMQKPGG